MLMQVIRLARENYRAKVLSLAVFKDNSVAKHCYQSLGFIEQQMIQRTFKEECWDLLMMEKTL